MRRSAIPLLALLVALSVALGCSRGRSDQAIATDIQAKMFSDPQVKPANVRVAVKDGEVTLTGDVPSDSVRYLAYKVATETPGVKRVNDQMTLKVAETPAPPPAESEPAPAPAPRPKVVKRLTAPPREPSPAPAPAPATPAPVEATAPPPPPQPKRVEIPAATTISVRMIDSVDSEINHTGEIFHASLDAPVVVDNEVIVPAGTDVYVKLITARSAGRLSGQSELALELVRMEFQGKSYLLASDEYRQKGTSRGKRTAAMAGGGAALGGLIGAVAGGGKGAAIGAAVGAAGGTGVQAATKGQQIKIPSETKLDFRLQQPVEVSYFPEKNQTRTRH